MPILEMGQNSPGDAPNQAALSPCSPVAALGWEQGGRLCGPDTPLSGGDPFDVGSSKMLL